MGQVDDPCCGGKRGVAPENQPRRSGRSISVYADDSHTRQVLPRSARPEATRRCRHRRKPRKRSSEHQWRFNNDSTKTEFALIQKYCAAVVQYHWKKLDFITMFFGSCDSSSKGTIITRKVCWLSEACCSCSLGQKSGTPHICTGLFSVGCTLSCLR